MYSEPLETETQPNLQTPLHFLKFLLCKHACLSDVASPNRKHHAAKRKPNFSIIIIFIAKSFSHRDSQARRTCLLWIQSEHSMFLLHVKSHTCYSVRVRAPATLLQRLAASSQQESPVIVVVVVIGNWLIAGLFLICIATW